MIAPGISVLTRKLFCPTKLRKALDTRGHTWPSTLTTRMPAAAVTMQAVKSLESFQFWKVVLHKTHQNQTPSWLCSVLHWAGMQIIRYHFVVIKDMPLFVHWAQLDRCFTECRMHQVAFILWASVVSQQFKGRRKRYFAAFNNHPGKIYFKD